MNAFVVRILCVEKEKKEKNRKQAEGILINKEEKKLESYHL
jgi:hypothetical protein